MQTPAAAPAHTIHISSRSSISFADVKELWEYKDLILLFVRRDFLAKYSQTVLGPIWFVIQPVLTALVFTVIFGNVANVQTEGMPRLLFYLCALLPWNYFAQTFGATGSTFTGNRVIFTKIYFPRLTVPFSSVISNLLAFGIQCISFACFWLYFKFFTAEGAQFHLTWGMALIPLLIVQVAGIGVGTGLCLAVITAKYRDLQHALPFLIQIWMYGTPIIYGLSMVENPTLRMVLSLNPMASITELFRFALLGKTSLTPAEYGISAGMTVVLLIAGLVMFKSIDRNVVDSI
jgi:lipopolysaccharide transport system permease protein